MFQIFIFDSQLVLISFFIFIVLLTGELLILSQYYLKGGFQKENTKSNLNFLIVVLNIIYFGLSFINLFVFLISISVLTYWVCYLLIKSEFSNKNDSLLQINFYWILAFLYVLFSYYGNVNLNNPNEIIIYSSFVMLFILWNCYSFNRYLIYKKRAISFRNKSRAEIPKKNYNKALNYLGKAVQASNKIWGITKIENQLKIEFNNLETTIKEGNFNNLERIVLENVNQKTQMLIIFFICTICIFLINFFLIFIY